MLCQGVVVAISYAADWRLDASLGQALSVADADILRPAVLMVNQAAAMDEPAIMDGLLEGIQHEAGVCGAADPSCSLKISCNLSG